MMLQLELLPAGPGDCLWLEYGEPGKTHICLIDGGVKDTIVHIKQRIGRAINDRATSKLHIDLLVITHIDNDHIDGILELLQQTEHQITFGDVWFNGHHQLANLPEPSPEERRSDLLGNLGEIPRPDLLGLKEGDALSSLLSTRKMPWNSAFNGAAVMAPLRRPLASQDFEGGLKLTVLGPPIVRLRKLAESWKHVKDAEIDEREDLLGRRDIWPPVWQKNSPSPDESVNNGSSIVLLAEYGDKSLLLTGDAYAADIEAGITRLQVERGKGDNVFPITALKLPHHGSARNISQKLLERLDCALYLVSTDGSGNSKHPDQQTLLRVLKYSSQRPCLAFNYGNETNRRWHDSRDEVLLLQLGLGTYTTFYPRDPNWGLVVELE